MTGFVGCGYGDATVLLFIGLDLKSYMYSAQCLVPTYVKGFPFFFFWGEIRERLITGKVL